jgi:hypothetical protein
MKNQTGDRVNAGFTAMFADGVLTYFEGTGQYATSPSRDPGVLDALARVIDVGVKAGRAAEGRQRLLPRRRPS